MRIAHINLSAGLRGAEFQTLALIRALEGRIDQRLVVRRGGQLLERAANLRGCQIYPVPGSLLAAARATRGCDLIHVHEGRSTKAGAIAALWGMPFIVTRRIQKPPSENFVTRYCYRQAGAVIGISNAVSATMASYLGNNQSVDTIYDGVTLTARRKVTRKSSARFVVGCVGELHDAVKGQSTLFAAARLLKKNPNIAFWIVGRGQDEARMRAWAADLNNVQFAGWVSDMEQCYADIDLLVHPARQEGLGSAILEAMSFGIPVVGSRVGGIPEVVRPGCNGELFDPEDVEALAAIISRYAVRKDLFADSCTGALQTADKYSTKVMADLYLRRYRELLEGQPNAAVEAKPSGST